MSLLVKRGDSPQDRFAAQVLELFRSDERVEDAWYDREQFAISVRPVGGTPVWARLAEVYQEVGPADPGDTLESLRKFVDSTVRPPELPDSWQEARPLVRPVLRGITAVLPSSENSDSGPLWRRSLPFLAEVVELDMPGGPLVSLETVQRWAVPPEDVLAQARENLSQRRMSPRPPRQAGSRVLRLVDDGGTYCVSHLLIDGWLAGFSEHLGVRPVALAPDRSTLLIAADEPGTLSTLFEMVEEEYGQSPRPVSPMAYTVEGDGRLVPYAAPPGHPLYAPAGRAERVLASAEYGRQKRWLDQFSSPHRTGSMMLAGRSDGSIFSVASVTPGVPTLLPHTDYVALVMQGDMVFLPWQAAEQILRLKPESDLEPARYLVDDWSSDGSTEALRDAAVDPSEAIAWR
ncbi:MAG TPA: hypothetical protein VFZ32_00875 [Micromonosporaceae bacterium]